MVAAGKAAKPDHSGLSYAEVAARQGQGQPAFTRNSWAALAEEDDDDAADDHGGVDAAGDNDEVWHDDQKGEDHADDAAPEEGHGPTEDDLKQEWVAACHSCRLLERDTRTPSRLVGEARAQRDEAERRWRAAKTPHPLHKRLRWAENELNEAMAKEEAHRRELQAHLESSARRTAQLQERQATDVARVARKREALAALLSEGAGAPRPLPAAERAARIAATGISTDVAPSLAAAIERLGAPLGGGEEVEGVRQELQIVAVSLARLEEVLRDGNAASAAEAMAASAQHYDISDHHRGRSPPGGDGACAQGGSSSDGAGKPAVAPANARWTRNSTNGPWRRSDDDDDGTMAAAPGSSAAAAAASRAALRRRLDGGHDSGVAAAAASAGGASAGLSGSTPTAVDTQLPLAAATNDLAEAERRAHQAAQLQLAESLRRQQRQLDDQQRQHDDAERQRREQLQSDEMRRHQQAVQQAAERQAAEEARQRSELLATMSPAELARAAELHAVQNAIGAQVFGTEGASQAVGMAYLHEAQRAAREAEAKETDRLMELSPQDLAAEQGTAW